MAAAAGFADLLAKARSSSGPRLLTPEDPEHAWCAVAFPWVLAARVSAGGGGSPDALVPLLPLIFEKLLGQPLDSAPWGVPVVRVSRGDVASAAGGGGAGIRVSAAVPVPPPGKERLFEVSTPLGPATLRIEGVTDTVVVEDRAEAPAELRDQHDAVLVLSLPSDWLEPSLLREAWACRSLELPTGRRAKWAAWLSQWGDLARLELSAHAGEREAEGFVLLAATFSDAAARLQCEAALGGGRLLVLDGPQRAADPHAKCLSRQDFDQQVESAWREHLAFEQEISRMDGAQVLEDAADALPSSGNGCFSPLRELFEHWLRGGILHATSTICAQRRLQEADASAAGKPAEAFRRACWHAAFRVAMQVEPSDENAETLSLALCEHWRKAHGICLDAGAAELLELQIALREAWARSRLAEAAKRESAEAEALSAEKALLEELVEEEGRAARERERRRKERRKQKERQRKVGAKLAEAKSPGALPGAGDAASASASGSASASSGDEALTPSGTAAEAASIGAASQQGKAEDASPLEVARRMLLSSYSRWARAAHAQAQRAAREAAAAQKKASRQSAQAAATAAQPPPPARRSADIESILEAVRRSEELRSQAARPAPSPPAAPGDGQRPSEAAQPTGDGHHQAVGTPPAAHVLPAPAGSRRGGGTPLPAIFEKDGEYAAACTADGAEEAVGEADVKPCADKARKNSGTSISWEAASTCSASASEPLSAREQEAGPPASAAPASATATPRGAALLWSDMDDAAEDCANTSAGTSHPPPAGAALPAPAAAPGAPRPLAVVAAVPVPLADEEDVGESDGEGDEGADGLLPSSPTSPSRRRARRRRRRGGDKAPASTISNASTASGGAGGSCGVSAHSEEESAQAGLGGDAKPRGVVTWGDLGLMSGFGAQGQAAAARPPPLALCSTSTARAPPQVTLDAVCLSTVATGQPITSPSRGACDASERFMLGSPVAAAPAHWAGAPDVVVSSAYATAGSGAPAWGLLEDMPEQYAMTAPSFEGPPPPSPSWRVPPPTPSALGAPECFATSGYPLSPVAASNSDASARGTSMMSWLHASGLPVHGEDLAQRLRAMAPAAYED